MSDFQAMAQAYAQAGGDAAALTSPAMATMVVSGNKVLGSRTVPGIEFSAEELTHGVKAGIRVLPRTRLAMPVHLCFGVLPTHGVQEILATYEIGEDADVTFLAHCTFPNAVEVRHVMSATLHVGRNARLRYAETHFHGPNGGVQVLPTAAVIVDEGGEFITTFSLAKGRAGAVTLDYSVDVAERGIGGIADLTTRIMGSGQDRIKVAETIRLNGVAARGVARARLALADDATGEVVGTTEGNAPDTRGHIDCIEVVRGRARAHAIPIVRVSDPQAQVTHEAAIGTVNRKELETLMARGLDEEAAVDMIVRGMLAG
jgi:Fe-S cluster assembly scaffold protein SufB